MRSVTERERLYRTEAVVLRRQDLGEADRLLTLFTPAYGKIRALAKGIRRPGSRKAGHLEPFIRVDALIARGRELDIVTQAEALSNYAHLSDDLVRLGQAAYLAELMDRFTVEGEGNPPLYRLLVHMLSSLDAGDDPGGVVRYFQIRLLDNVGFRPELFRCVDCGTELKPEDHNFSSMKGGMLCPRCGSSHAEAIRISLDGLKVLRYYQRNPYEVAIQPRIRIQVADEVEALMQNYLSYLLERELRAPGFVREVRRLRERGA